MYKHVYTCTHLHAGICQRFSLGGGPQPFQHQGPVWWKTICPQTAGWWGDGLGMIKEHYVYCAFYFYYYHISSTSDHQALESRGWGPLL